MIELEKGWLRSFLSVTIVFYTSVTFAMWWRSGMLSSFVGVVIELWTCFATIVVTGVLLHMTGKLRFVGTVASGPVVIGDTAKPSLIAVTPVEAHPLVSTQQSSAPEMERKEQ